MFLFVYLIIEIFLDTGTIMKSLKFYSHTVFMLPFLPVLMTFTELTKEPSALCDVGRRVDL